MDILRIEIGKKQTYHGGAETRRTAGWPAFLSLIPPPTRVKSGPLSGQDLAAFVIDPGSMLETEYADVKTGDWRPIKRWPLIHSQTHRIKR